MYNSLYYLNFTKRSVSICNFGLFIFGITPALPDTHQKSPSMSFTCLFHGINNVRTHLIFWTHQLKSSQQEPPQAFLLVWASTECISVPWRAKKFWRAFKEPIWQGLFRFHKSPVAVTGNSRLKTCRLCLLPTRMERLIPESEYTKYSVLSTKANPAGRKLVQAISKPVLPYQDNLYNHSPWKPQKFCFYVIPLSNPNLAQKGGIFLSCTCCQLSKTDSHVLARCVSLGSQNDK